MNNCVLYKGLCSEPTSSIIDSYYSEFGSFGSGLYCADYDTALVYADEEKSQILKMFVNMDNPMVVPVNFEPGWEIDFDSAALPLLRQLFDEDKVVKLVRNSKDGLFDETIQLAVTEKGHDGLIVVYNKECFETIVYDHKKITLLP